MNLNNCPCCSSETSIVFRDDKYPYFIGFSEKPLSRNVYKLQLHQCSLCEFIFQDRSSDFNRKVLKNFYNNGPGNSSHYAKDSIYSLNEHNNYFSKIKPHIKISDNCLEIGCGDGYLLEKFAKEKIFKYGVGIEPSKHFIYNSLLKNMHVVNDFFPTISLTDSKFDIIYSTAVLEHIFNLEDFFNSVNKALNENGTFISIVPNQLSLFSKSNIGHVTPEHVNYFNEFSLISLYKKYGFNIDLLDINSRYIFVKGRKILDKVDDFLDLNSIVKRFGEYVESGQYSFYGASGELFNLLNLCDKNFQEIRIYDSDKNKHGKYFLEKKCEVISPDEIRLNEKIVIVPFNHRFEIEKSLKELNKSVEIIQFFC